MPRGIYDRSHLKRRRVVSRRASRENTKIARKAIERARLLDNAPTPASEPEVRKLTPLELTLTSLQEELQNKQMELRELEDCVRYLEHKLRAGNKQ